MQNPNTLQNRFKSSLVKLRRFKHTFTVLLSLITIIGFWLRYKIGNNVSFWADEGQYLSLYKLDSIRKLVEYYWANTSNDQPLLMYILVYIWKSVVGIQPDQLRVLPLLISTAAIFATGHFCYRFSNSKSLSLIMATLTMLSPFVIRYSYDLTSYCLVSLLAPISFFLFLERIQKEKYSWSQGIILINILLLNTHYFSYFLVFSQGIIFLFLNFANLGKQTLRNLFLGSFVQIISALIPFYFLFSKTRSSNMESWIGRAHPDLWGVVSQTFTFDDFTRKTILLLIAILTIRFISLFDQYEKKAKIVLSCSILTFFLTLYSAWIVQKFTWMFIGHGRYLMVTFPILLFFAIYSFMSQKKYWSAGFVTTLIIVFFAYDISRYQPIESQDFRSASTYVEKKSAGINSLVFPVPFKNIFEYYFSLDKHNIEISPYELVDIFLDEKKMDGFLIYLKNHSIKKIFLAHTFLGDRKAMIRLLLADDFPKYFRQIGSAEHFKDIDIYELDVK